MAEFEHLGLPARWVCAGDGVRILWVRDPGDGITPPSCEPYGEDTCNCETCMAAKGAAV